MIRCNEGECEHGKGNMCCNECDCIDCKDRCECDSSECELSVMDGENGLTLFKSNALALMESIAELDKQKKTIEAQDAAIRQELQKAMDKYGVTSFENDILKITHVAPTTRTSIDSARLKKELPAVAEKYSKVSNVKGFVKIEVK